MNLPTSSLRISRRRKSAVLVGMLSTSLQVYKTERTVPFAHEDVAFTEDVRMCFVLQNDSLICCGVRAYTVSSEG